MVQISFSGPQSALEVLTSQDLLAAIMSRLQGLRDLLRCSAVNKAWNAASQNLQLASLGIQRTCDDVKPVDIYGLPITIQWLQEKHTQGAFVGIKTLRVCLEHAYTCGCHTEPLQSHLRSILSIAGTWGTLQSCSVKGDFPMDLPASLLPKNIQQLSMDLDTELDHSIGMKKPLSLFNRFLNLQSLKIHVVIDEDELDSSPGLQHYVLSSTFPQLTSLSLLDVPMHVSPSCTLATCLPVLTDLQVCVYPRKAQAILDMKTLKFLCMILLYKPGLDNHADLTVYKDSKLQNLRIKGSHESFVTVTIEKMDLVFCCSMITVKNRWLETLRDETVHFADVTCLE